MPLSGCHNQIIMVSKESHSPLTIVKQRTNGVREEGVCCTVPTS